MKSANEFEIWRQLLKTNMQMVREWAWKIKRLSVICKLLISLVQYFHSLEVEVVKKMKKSAENSSNDKKSNEESKVRFQCSKCNDTFNDAIALIDHISSAHDSKSDKSEEGFSMCAKCGIVIHNSLATNHEEIEHPYKCKSCKSSFVNEKNLAFHLTGKHKSVFIKSGWKMTS